MSAASAPDLIRDLIEDYARYAEHGDHDADYEGQCEVCDGLAALDRLVRRQQELEERAERLEEVRKAADPFGRWPERFVALDKIDEIDDAATAMMDMTAGQVKRLRAALAAVTPSGSPALSSPETEKH